jgi:uncharacterized protein (DUF1015 family)
MADLRAFRGFRYDLGRVGSLSDVVAPPYDVIDAALQKQLYDASPYNAIRLELTQDEPEDDETRNKYTRAAATLKDWLAEDVLRQDSARGFYVYEQEFTVEGQTHIRRGFLARVRLEPFGTGKIFPHEQTLSGPKADRLKLYTATHFNISPIFGLYPDSTNEVFQQVEPLIRSAPPLLARDHLGVLHRLWQITDQSVCSALIGLMGPRPIYIADGHHRYETGLKYLEEQKQLGVVPDDESPQNFCLMQLVSMSDPGLLILPTHRLLTTQRQWTAQDWQRLLQPHFDLVAEFGTNAQDCWEHIQMDGTQALLGFATKVDGQYFVMKLRDPAIMAERAPLQSEEWRSLAVSILHRLVLEKLLQDVEHQLPSCRYVHLLSEVTDALSAGECSVAALVPPCTMNHVAEIAGHGETMPPKSTYFYPKLLTGMVYHSLKRD